MIMGVKFKDEMENPPSVDDEEKIQPGETPALFGEPEAFAHLTEEERRAMTQRMIMGHKQKIPMKG